ncbi:hypothetical protein MSAN_01049000 [Mycena sanguinolenta]|uniref:Uncharacterized protein n=1 Tax=Mycena sanguinolenta TaxID=230812 RepID=A0A8H7D6B0_9AGAR|nr:hypothetical protein MSAN_01049000 [Mycena sanguinolenta]
MSYQSTKVLTRQFLQVFRIRQVAHQGFTLLAHTVPGSSSELLPMPVAVSNAASPWGALATPCTADSTRSPWRLRPHFYQHRQSPLPLAEPLRSHQVTRSSPLSPATRHIRIHSFLQPVPCAGPHLPPASVHSSPRLSARSSPESALLPPEPCAAPATEMESRATREIRLQYEERGCNSATSQHPPRAGTSLAPPISPEPLMTPAALAKEQESRAAQLIRAGYEIF